MTTEHAPVRTDTSRRRNLALLAVVALVCAAGLTTTGLSAFSAARTGTVPHAVTGSLSEFNLCPVDFTNASVVYGVLCGHSETTGGQIKLGNSSAPLSNNPDTVDVGAYRPSSQTQDQANQLAIVLPTNGRMFGGPAQPVPGGLLGLMCPSGIPAVSLLCQQATTNPNLAGVTASLELAAPPSPATLLEPTADTYWFDPFAALGGSFGSTALLRVPVKFHLQNVLLGSSCYVGSDASPIVLSLMRLDSPNEHAAFKGRVVVVTGVNLGDSTFAVPGATGCGPLGVADPAINLKEGWPSPSGSNSVVIQSDAEVVAACVVKGTC
jgi:hypothetical protein